MPAAPATDAFIRAAIIFRAFAFPFSIALL
jgi:hypothetical protein